MGPGGARQDWASSFWVNMEDRPHLITPAVRGGLFNEERPQGAGHLWSYPNCPGHPRYVLGAPRLCLVCLFPTFLPRSILGSFLLERGQRRRVGWAWGDLWGPVPGTVLGHSRYFVRTCGIVGNLRAPEQDTGGSRALCLLIPPSSRVIGCGSLATLPSSCEWGGLGGLRTEDRRVPYVCCMYLRSQWAGGPGAVQVALGTGLLLQKRGRGCGRNGLGSPGPRALEQSWAERTGILGQTMGIWEEAESAAPSFLS